MKVLLALRNIADFRHLDEVVRHLCRDQHTVTIWIEEDFKENTTNRAVRACLDEINAERRGAELHFLPFLTGEEGELASGDALPNQAARRRDFLRNWINYAFYFRDSHPSFGMRYRWRRHLPSSLKMAEYLPLMKRVLVSRPLSRRLKKRHDALGLEASLLRKLREEKPDVVVATPFIKRGYLEVETVRAAQSLNIPTVVAVLSWDNLTSRGTFHATPDILLVWNAALREEAVALHEIARERIVITGAPTFDFWFDMKPAQGREAFCRQVGLQSQRPFLTYLGSSRTIATGEADHLSDFARVLAGHDVTRDMQILVRPHPLNARSWENFQQENVAVWPRGGQWPDVRETRQDYFDTLFHSAAVMGVNTSGFLDAAIVDKPCLTLLTERYRHAQTGRGHFAHLMRGDFLEVAHSFEEAASLLGAIAGGADLKAAPRRDFVRDFIRPNGRDKSAGALFAQAVTLAARRRSAAQIEAALSGATAPHDNDELCRAESRRN